MSFSEILDIFEPSFLLEEPELSFPQHLFHSKLTLSNTFSSPCETQMERTLIFSSDRRIRSVSRSDSFLKSLCHQVWNLELGFNRILAGDRKYAWTAEIKCPETDRKYQWTAEIEGSEKHSDDRNYKWTAEIESPEKNGTYKRTAVIEGGKHRYSKVWSSKGLKNRSVRLPFTWVKIFYEIHDILGYDNPSKTVEWLLNAIKKDGCATPVVEIEEPVHHGKAFAKTAGAVLSPENAALIIQKRFRAFLIRRSQALRSLRELALAKGKLKEIRALFNNFSYRQSIAHDSEERQRLCERIFVFLLTVDAIQGVDLMVRGARRSMLDQLEAMLDVVDPQPLGKLSSIKRRNFNGGVCPNA